MPVTESPTIIDGQTRWMAATGTTTVTPTPTLPLPADPQIVRLVELDDDRYENDVVVTTLRRARNLIARPGRWIQHAARRRVRSNTYGKYMYGYCSIGAINALRSTDNFVKQTAVQYLGNDIVAFNDARDRTLNEVLNRFDNAIEKRKQDIEATGVKMKK